MYFSTTYPSPVGILTLASDGENLTGLWIEGQKYFGDTIHEAMVERDSLPVFQAAKGWLDRYFAGKQPSSAELPLRPIGGAFRQGVWQLLCGIPYGKVVTYGDIAKEMAAKLGKKPCPARQWAGPSATTPFRSSFPATGWWELAEA